MADLERWNSSAEAPPELRQLLQTAKQDLPTAAELGSLESKLDSLLDKPVPPANAPGAPPAASSSVPALTKLAVLVAVGGLVGTGAWLSAKSQNKAAAEATSTLSTEARPAPVKASASVEAARAPAERTEPKKASRVAEPAPTAEAPTAPRAAPALVKKPSEASLLSQAQAALKSNPRRALALTQRHKQLYPSGVLSQEREVIAIEALARLDQKGSAKQKASEFSKKYPESAHQKKVDTTLDE